MRIGRPSKPRRETGSSLGVFFGRGCVDLGAGCGVRGHAVEADAGGQRRLAGAFGGRCRRCGSGGNRLSLSSQIDYRQRRIARTAAELAVDCAAENYAGFFEALFVGVVMGLDVVDDRCLGDTAVALAFGAQRVMS